MTFPEIELAYFYGQLSSSCAQAIVRHDTQTVRPHEMISAVSKSGLLLFVQVSPNSASTAIGGVYNDRLKIKLAAKAIDEMANVALIELLADLFSVSKSNVEVIKGEHSKLKTISIRGDADSLLSKLQDLVKVT